MFAVVQTYEGNMAHKRDECRGCGEELLSIEKYAACPKCGGALRRHKQTLREISRKMNKEEEVRMPVIFVDQ